MMSFIVDRRDDEARMVELSAARRLRKGKRRKLPVVAGLLVVAAPVALFLLPQAVDESAGLRSRRDGSRARADPRDGGPDRTAGPAE
jgi:hypothetical protein